MDCVVVSLCIMNNLLAIAVLCHSLLLMTLPYAIRLLPIGQEKYLVTLSLMMSIITFITIICGSVQYFFTQLTNWSGLLLLDFFVVNVPHFLAMEHMIYLAISVIFSFTER